MVVIAIVVSALPVAGQNWTAPQTPWGDPDLQGLWPSVQLLSVPIERPVKLGTKATLTHEEFGKTRAVAVCELKRLVPTKSSSREGRSHPQNPYELT